MKIFLTALIIIVIVIGSAGIAYVDYLSRRGKNGKYLEGDFSSFNRECPEKDCGWYFQDEEMLAEHIKKGKHGV